MYFIFDLFREGYPSTEVDFQGALLSGLLAISFSFAGTIGKQLFNCFTGFIPG